MHNVTYRDALSPAWSQSCSTPLPDDAIIQFSLPNGIIEIRHKGSYLEVCNVTYRGRVAADTRLTVEPRAGNILFLQLELQTDVTHSGAGAPPRFQPFRYWSPPQRPKR